MAKAADSRAILCHERKRNRTGKPRGGSFRDRMGGGRREGGRDSSCYGSQKPPHPPALCQPVPPPRCSLSGPAAHPLVRHPGCLARLFCLSDLPVALLLSQLLPPRCPCPPHAAPHPHTPTPPHTPASCLVDGVWQPPAVLAAILYKVAKEGRLRGSVGEAVKRLSVYLCLRS